MTNSYLTLIEQSNSFEIPNHNGISSELLPNLSSLSTGPEEVIANIDCLDGINDINKFHISFTPSQKNVKTHEKWHKMSNWHRKNAWAIDWWDENFWKIQNEKEKNNIKSDEACKLDFFQSQRIRLQFVLAVLAMEIRFQGEIRLCLYIFMQQNSIFGHVFCMICMYTNLLH